MKTIFTDIEGVLCAPDTLRQLKLEDSSIEVNHCALPWAQLLADLLGDVNVEIVIHSSWRHHYSLVEIKKYFPVVIQGRIVACVLGHGRYDGILSYIDKNSIKEFVVLDDIADFFPENWKYLILCNSDVGLSDPVVQKKLRDFLR